MGLTSDRRVSAKPLHAMLWILAIYNPECDGTCLVIASAQLFGCSVIPFDLYRIPNWCSIVVTRLLLIALLVVWRLFDLRVVFLNRKRPSQCASGSNVSLTKNVAEAEDGNRQVQPKNYCLVCQSQYCNPWNHWNHNPGASDVTKFEMMKLHFACTRFFQATRRDGHLVPESLIEPDVYPSHR